jgi:hypothetical protein
MSAKICSGGRDFDARTPNVGLGGKDQDCDDQRDDDGAKPAHASLLMFTS